MLRRNRPFRVLFYEMVFLAFIRPQAHKDAYFVSMLAVLS
jgi:hypothetical protein